MLKNKQWTQREQVLFKHQFFSSFPTMDLLKMGWLWLVRHIPLVLSLYCEQMKLDCFGSKNMLPVLLHYHPPRNTEMKKAKKDCFTFSDISTLKLRMFEICHQQWWAIWHIKILATGQRLGNKLCLLWGPSATSPHPTLWSCYIMVSYPGKVKEIGWRQVRKLF